MHEDSRAVQQPGTAGAPAPAPVIRLGHYTQADLDEISGEGPDPFEVAEFGLTWRPKDHHFGIRAGNRLVAHAGLTTVPVSAGGHHLRVAGLGGVIVAPHLRGHGLARSVVTAAMEHARGQGHRLLALTKAVDHVTVGLSARWSRRGETPVATVDRVG
ncbi:GNAT family N-acetyltransferase [Streptomyces sp. NPDC005329]|uniref:GNAT family N-acetyltransferase n=1 Tax=Streptomyces sp. NPDC005329 TaxID=3157034 RepID=UPI0033BC2D2C